MPSHEEVKDENKALVEKFFKLVNYMGNERELADLFGMTLVREHRTLQQNTVRFMAEVLKYYVENIHRIWGMGKGDQTGMV